jgi:hypothetical protein
VKSLLEIKFREDMPHARLGVTVELSVFKTSSIYERRFCFSLYRRNYPLKEKIELGARHFASGILV